MGNCWGSSPVDHHSSNALPTKQPVAAYMFDEIPVRGVASYNNGSGSNNLGRAGGGFAGGSSHNAVPRKPPSASSSSTVGKITTPNLKIFTLAELKSATKNFRADTVLGEGGFGKVFKGWIDQTTMAPSKYGVGMAVAVKKCSSESTQGIKEWKTEVNFLGKFSHPNLVRLIGYCCEENDLLLVYEYLQKGSLEKTDEPPPWGTRIRIAMDAARGLDFLHTTENTVIYRDFKAANILLDENYGAKLSDFGLARLGPSNGKSHVTTQAVGTYGYAAPEYIATGHLYVKSDVYGFGVVLLEMLTGLRAYDMNRPTAQHNLVDWYKPILQDRAKVKKIIDPRMEEYPPEGVQKLVQLVLRCLENDPKSRPSMADVVIILERISTILMQPSKPKAQQKPKTVLPGPTGPFKPNPLATPRRDTGPLLMNFTQGTTGNSHLCFGTAAARTEPASNIGCSKTSMNSSVSYRRSMMSRQASMLTSSPAMATTLILKMSSSRSANGVIEVPISKFIDSMKINSPWTKSLFVKTCSEISLSPSAFMDRRGTGRDSCALLEIQREIRAKSWRLLSRIGLLRSQWSSRWMVESEKEG
ncbi:hypothetical protein V2J09_017310 [Rumex salicifolius]